MKFDKPVFLRYLSFQKFNFKIRNDMKKWNFIVILMVLSGILLLVAGAGINLANSFSKEVAGTNNASMYGVGFLLLIVGLALGQPRRIDRS